MGHSKQYNNEFQCAFFEFTTGAPRPLSSKYAVSLPLSKEFDYADEYIEVLGDHILVVLSNFGPLKSVIYLVSWKTGTVTCVSGLSESLSHPRLTQISESLQVYRWGTAGESGTVACGYQQQFARTVQGRHKWSGNL